MLNIEAPPSRFLIGIDPGSETIGISKIELNTVSLDIISIDADTFIASKLPFNLIDQLTNGDRYAKIRALSNHLSYLFDKYNPIAVCCESPFYNSRMPAAFGSLTEVLCAIRQALEKYDPWQKLQLLDPPNVKKAVGAKGNADKDQMRQAISKHSEIFPCLLKSIDQYDEHSLDSIAVAYSFYTKYVNQQN